MPDPNVTLPHEAAPEAAGRAASAPVQTPGADSTLDPNRTGELGAPAPGGPLPTVPGYEIVRELGRGGMGVVYEASQIALNRIVALKMIRAAAGASAAEVARFVAEAEAVAAVRHPNVVQVFECGRYGDLPYMALELLRGGSLDNWVKRSGPLPARAAAELVAQIADGVAAAHELGIVHRDLKPGNVLLTERGEPKVTDFGLARRGNSDLTQTGALMGTPNYMAPEQAAGRAKFVGPAADVYAIGVILFECLTGTVPFRGPDTWALIRQVVNDPPPRPRALAPGVSRDLELICLKCLEKEPHERYATAADLAADLRNYLADRPVTARPIGRVPRAWRAVKRNPVIAGAAAAVVLSLTVGLSVALVKADDAKRSAADATAALGVARTEEDRAKLALGAQLEAEKHQRAEFDQRVATEQRLRRTAELVNYARELRVAQERLSAGDVPGAEQALAACPTALRDWEWGVLNQWLARAAPVLARVPELHMSLAMAVSPDGRWVASAGRPLDPRGALAITPGCVWLWDLKTRRPPVKLPGEMLMIGALAFDADSKRVAVVGDRARVWDLADPTKPGLVSDPLSGSALAARFTPAGLVAVSSDTAKDEARVLTWAAGAKQPAAVTVSFPFPTTAAIAPDGSAVLLAGLLPGPPPFPGGPPPNQTARVFTAQGKPLGDAIEFAARATAAAFTADGKGAVVATTTAQVRGEVGAALLVVRGADRKPGARVRLLCDEVRKLEFRPDGSAVLCTGAPGSAGEVLVWEPEGGLVTSGGKVGPCGGVAFFPDGRFTFSDSKTGPRLLLPSGPAAQTFGPPAEALAGFALLDNERLVTSSYPVFDGTKPAKLFAHRFDGGPAAPFVPDLNGQWVLGLTSAGPRVAVSIAAGMDKPAPVLLVDPVSRTTVHRWVPPAGVEWQALASDARGTRVALGGSALGDKFTAADRAIKLYSTATGKLERDLALPGATFFPAALAVAPDGRFVAAALSAPYTAVPGNVPELPPGAVVVWNADTGAVVWTAEKVPRNVTAVAFSRDGALVAAGGGDRVVRVWHADGKPFEREFPIPTLGQDGPGWDATIRAVALSPDGARLLALNPHGLLLWDTATGQFVASIPLHRGAFGNGQYGLAFAPDGRRLVASDGAGSVLVFDPAAPER